MTLLEGEAGVDNIDGGNGNDRIFGMTEADPTGSVFADFLNGGKGNDQITGANASIRSTAITATIPSPEEVPAIP